MLLTVLVPVLLTSPAFTDSGHHETALVVFSDVLTLREGAQSVEALGGQTRRCFEAGRVCIFDFPRGASWDLLATLPGVRSVEPDGVMGEVRQETDWNDVHGTLECDEGFWELEAIGITTVWKQVTGRDAPAVMVCDGGFLTSHRDLETAFAGGYDYGNDDPVTEVEWGVGTPAHGTFISGLIAATADNGFGRVGLMPNGQVFAAKNSNSSGSFKYSYTIAALADAAEDPNIRVVSYSLTSSTWSDSYYAAIEGLGASDTLLVAAAGNCSKAPPECPDVNNDISPKYPGNYPGSHVIQVGGVRPGDEWNPKSHYGVETVDLAAPGVSLCSLGVDSDEHTYTAAGTSYAAPLVAASAALVMEAHPQLSAIEVADTLRLTAAVNEALKTKVTFGRVDAAAAVAMPWVRGGFDASSYPVVGEGSADVMLVNRGGAGTVWLLVTHDASVQLGVATHEGWSVEAVNYGATVTLPSGRGWIADRPAAIFRGSLDQHETLALTIPLLAIADGIGHLTVSGVAISSYGHWRDVVGQSDTERDATGAPAWAARLEVETVPDMPEDSGAELGRRGDHAASDIQPRGSDLTSLRAPSPSQGCTSSPRAPLIPFILLVLCMVLWRRVAGPTDVSPG